MNEYERPVFFHLMEYASKAEGDVIDMVSGDPDWEPPTALREGLREYADADVDEFQYPPSHGLEELRAEIADRRGVDIERVLITNGAGEANYIATVEALRELNGSEVIIADPVYPYYYNRIQMLDATPRLVSCAADGSLDPEAVREAASEETAAICICSPNNPTGAVYGGAVKRELLEIAEANDALFISDEVYEQFVYEDGAFESALSFDSDRLVVTNSFSKAMAITGFRVGYAILPEWLVGPSRTRHMLTNVAGSRPSQYAVLRALRETPESYHERNRAMLDERIDRFCEALDAAGAEYTRPRGSFYVMARFESYPGTLENVERLIDDVGVAGMPGDAFSSSRADWLRFALVTPRVEEAAERLAAYFS